MGFRRVVTCAWLLLCWSAIGTAQSSVQIIPQRPVDGITRLVGALEQATADGNADAIRALASPEVRPASLAEFVLALTFPRASRYAVKDRDRAATEDGKVRLLVETFTERAGEGRVASWRIDVAPVGATEGPWTIVAIERLTVVSGLY